MKKRMTDFGPLTPVVQTPTVEEIVARSNAVHDRTMRTDHFINLSVYFPEVDDFLWMVERA